VAGELVKEAEGGGTEVVGREERERESGDAAARRPTTSLLSARNAESSAPKRIRAREDGGAKAVDSESEPEASLSHAGVRSRKTKVPVAGDGGEDGVPIRGVRASIRRGIPPCGGCRAGLDTRTGPIRCRAGLDPMGAEQCAEGGSRGARWVEQREEAEGGEGW
jgi:hypothetical protein